MSYLESPPPPLSRASLVIGLYGAMALVALLLAAGRGNPDLYRIGSPSGFWLLVAPVLGIVVGLVVVLLTRIATKKWAWARSLHGSFRDLLGPLTMREIVILAAASSIGEELLFRGALMPWIGVWLQALVFALLHVGPGKKFIPWTISAAVLGVAFGELAVATGSLGAPIAAHFTINFLNLRYIVAPRTRGALDLDRATLPRAS
jgi:membrane protease YdiL (CAAX protease family)